MKQKFYITVACLFAAVVISSCVKDEKPNIPPGDSPVVINEAYSNGGRSTYGDIDWVELYNPSDEAADVSNFILSDKVDKAEKITLPANTVIAAKGFLVVEVDIVGGFGLGSGGDMVYLYDATGAVVNDISFPALTPEQSYARNPDGSTTYKIQTPTPGTSNNNAVVAPSITNAAHNPASPTGDDEVVVSATVTAGDGTLSSVKLEWAINTTAQTAINMTAAGNVYSATIAPQAVGATIAYSVVAVNSAGGSATVSGSYTVRDAAVASYDGLVINEVDGNGKFIELYNSGAEAVTLTGVQLVKNEETDAADIWWTGGAATITPGDYYTICEAGNETSGPLVDEATGNGGISAAKNVKFELKTPTGEVLDVFLRSATLDLDASCTPAYQNTTPKYAFARCPDGIGPFGLAEPSIDAANPFAPDGPIVTNEATSKWTSLVINEVDGNGKFVEIYNTADVAVNLNNVSIIKNGEVADPWWIGGDVSIAAGDYYTICQTGGALAAEVDEATGNGGISPKKTVRFDLVHDALALDVFARVKADNVLDANCTPDYGVTTPPYSFARCPDGTGNFGLAVPSVDAANPATAVGAIVTE